MPTPARTPTETPTPEVSLDDAREIYTPQITQNVLTGRVESPEGFDVCIVETIGQTRLDTLRAGSDQVAGQENDAAAVCLLRLEVPVESVTVIEGPSSSGPGPGAGPAPGPAATREPVTVELVDSTYGVAPGGTSGSFKSGQDADIMLSGFGFNKSGGPLAFNHNAGIASDGTRLYLADVNNNRVLIWNTLPDANVEPDLVLGQQNFDTNAPGLGRDEMNWPVDIATDGTRLVISDTNNYRVLIWTSPPTRNAQPADLVLQGGDFGENITNSKTTKFFWPWGVWTDGKKLAVASTSGGAVFVWNEFPTVDDEPADFVLTAGGQLGTPRSFVSDGESLIIGDHNARVEGQPETGNFFWRTFPSSDDDEYDFYRVGFPWLRGDFSDDGKLVLIDDTLRIWNAFPEDLSVGPDLSIDKSIYDLRGGDHGGVAVVGDQVFVSSGNSNKVLVYNSLPTDPGQAPDFAIGSPRIDVNTLETFFIVSNPVVISNGTSLFAPSDFDRALYVWKELPDESGAHPDIVYSLEGQVFDGAVWGDDFVMAGGTTLYIWRQLPLTGNLPDLVIEGAIGSISFENLKSVALDDKFFYLGDSLAHKVYVYEGIPTKESEPAFTLDVNNPWRMSSDGNYLTIATLFDNDLLVYEVEGLEAGSEPVKVGGHGTFNGLQAAVAAHGQLFAVDGGFAKVHIWSSNDDALAGNDADAILGANLHRQRPEIGRNTLFTPAAVSFDGTYLWVGETKFSERILRFSPSP